MSKPEGNVNVIEIRTPSFLCEPLSLNSIQQLTKFTNEKCGANGLSEARHITPC